MMEFIHFLKSELGRLLNAMRLGVLAILLLSGYSYG